MANSGDSIAYLTGTVSVDASSTLFWQKARCREGSATVQAFKKGHAIRIVRHPDQHHHDDQRQHATSSLQFHCVHGQT
jgi:hypothetical protein